MVLQTPTNAEIVSTPGMLLVVFALIVIMARSHRRDARMEFVIRLARNFARG
jgi:hypothetical protein